MTSKDIKSMFNVLRTLHNDHVNALQARTNNHLDLLDDVKDFLEKRAQIEHQFSKSMVKLVKDFTVRRPPTNSVSSPEKPNVFSTEDVWSGLLQDATAAAKSRETLSVSLREEMNSLSTAAQNVSTECGKRAVTYAALVHGAVQLEVEACVEKCKTYQTAERDTLSATAALEDAQKRLSAGKKASFSFGKSLNTTKLKAKLEVCSARSEAARNAYLVQLEMSNALVRRYHTHEANALVELNDRCFHLAVRRIVRRFYQMNSEALDGMKNSLHSLVFTNENLNNDLDRALFMAQYSPVMLRMPAELPFYSLDGDTVSDISSTTDIQERVATSLTKCKELEVTMESDKSKLSAMLAEVQADEATISMGMNSKETPSDNTNSLDEVIGIDQAMCILAARAELPSAEKRSEMEELCFASIDLQQKIATQMQEYTRLTALCAAANHEPSDEWPADVPVPLIEHYLDVIASAISRERNKSSIFRPTSSSPKVVRRFQAVGGDRGTFHRIHSPVPLLIVEEDFEAKGDGDLSIMKGDVLNFVGYIEDGWIMAQHTTGEQESGRVPAHAATPRTPDKTTVFFADSQDEDASEIDMPEICGDGSVDKKDRWTFLNNKLKKRPQRDILRLKGITKRGVFGEDLGEICANSSNNIPEVVRVCIEALDDHAMTKEGVFRVPGSSAVVQSYRVAFDNNENPLLSVEDIGSKVFAIGGLLKLFFRELNEPLLTFDLYDKWLSACKNPNIPARMLAIRSVANQLPQANYDVFKYLLSFLNRMASQGSVNLMYSPNLAICFAPTVMRPLHETLSSMIQDSSASTQLIELLIDNVEWVFGKEAWYGTDPVPTPIETTVLYDYNASEPEELSLTVGDVVTILDKTDAHWWQGRVQDGIVGLIPCEYVAEN